MSQRLHPAEMTPCAACPWRTENHGKPHPHGWYLRKNLRRLWRALRGGETMSCHPTDPDNEVPDGAPEPPDDFPTRECAGGLILKQREAMRFQRECERATAAGTNDAMRRYRAASPNGLTKGGLIDVVERATFGRAGLARPMTMPDLNLPVSHPDLNPWNVDTEGSPT